MRYLLDTNFLSELRREDRANRGVLAWRMANATAQLAISVVSVCEIRQGIEAKRRTDPAQAGVLERWLAEILIEFAANFLPVTIEIADRWGILLAKINRGERDMLIAATALEHDLTLVTHNVSDFEDTGVRILDPWK